MARERGRGHLGACSLSALSSCVWLRPARATEVSGWVALPPRFTGRPTCLAWQQIILYSFVFFKKDYGSQLRVQEKCMDQVQRSSPALILPPWQQALCSTIEHKDPRTSVLMAPADKNPEGKEYPGWLAPSSCGAGALQPSRAATGAPVPPPGPEGQPEAEHQLRGPARGGRAVPAPAAQAAPRSAPGRTRLGAAPRLGGLQGSRGQPPAGTGRG